MALIAIPRTWARVTEFGMGWSLYNASDFEDSNGTGDLPHPDAMGSVTVSTEFLSSAPSPTEHALVANTRELMQIMQDLQLASTILLKTRRDNIQSQLPSTPTP